MDTIVTPPADQKADPVRQLLDEGQSPWLDFVRRSFIEDGSLKKLVEQDGLGGVTSNPSIFEKAMGAGDDYDAEFKTLAAGGQHDAQEIYETLAVADIQHVAEVLRPVFERTKGLDGYVSLEVSPYLALRHDETVAEARRLHAWVDRPNLMVKVPGTQECVPAIRTLISEGININVTLLFSIDAYKAVADALHGGAGRPARERRGHQPAFQCGEFLRQQDRRADRQENRRACGRRPTRMPTRCASCAARWRSPTPRWRMSGIRR